MAVSFTRGLPLIRHRLHHHLYHCRFATTSWTSHLWSIITERTPASDNSAASISAGQSISVLNDRYPSKNSRWDDPDFRKWKNKEAEMLKDIDPVMSATKEILHSDRYLDGERLTAEDEKLVMERLLAYHPHSEDKIGCGLDSIMVDRHPQFRRSRCLFVVRTDGGWIDFSYQKCVRAYIREKYPSHAERFIKEHFKRGSS